MQLSYETKHIWQMFDDVLADDLVKLVVSERIGKDTQVVNHVGMTPRVRIDADSSWNLILPAANVQNLFGRS